MTSLADYMSVAGLGETEREVIKKAYGLDRNNRRYDASGLAVSQHTTSENIRNCEASALCKLKETKIQEWLESRMDTDKAKQGERVLLDALNSTNTEKPTPYLFLEKTNVRGEEQPTSGNDTEANVSTESNGITTEVGVGDSGEGGSDATKETAAVEGAGGLNKAFENLDPNLQSRGKSGEDGVTITVARGSSATELANNMNTACAIEPYGFVQAINTYNDRQRRPEYTAFLFHGIDFSNKEGKRKCLTFNGTNPVDFIERMARYFNTNKCKNVTMTVTALFNTTVSRTEFLATITHT